MELFYTRNESLLSGLWAKPWRRDMDNLSQSLFFCMGKLQMRRININDILIFLQIPNLFNLSILMCFIFQMFFDANT